MKSRVLALLLMLVLIASLFMGCQQTVPKPNVDYFSIAQSFNKDGWKPFVSIKIVDTRIGKVSFDAVNVDASTSILGATAAGKSYNLDKNFAQQLKLCAKALIEKQTLDSFIFDANGITTQIPGVTKPVKEYFDLAKVAIAAGANNRADFNNDDFFTTKAKNFDKDGWKRKINIYVRSGSAIAANFDAVNKDGKSRKDIESDTKWLAQNKLIEDYFMGTQKQFFTLVVLKPDGTSNSIPGVTMNIKQVYELIKLAMGSSIL